MKKPNILFAIADDASHFGAYGHGFVKTPVCDGLAKNGALFENAFTPSPKCAPSRASILTGRYPWQNTEACNHQCFFPPGLTLFPDILEKNGYHVGVTGKGWGPGNYERAGYTRNPAGTEYNSRKLTPPEGTAISECDYAANFQDFLNARPEGAPFYFWYGGWEPHRRYVYGEGLRHGKKFEDLDKIPAYWPDDERVRTDILDYAFETEWFDTQLGRIIEILRQNGELENTLIIATSDNGCPFPRVKGQMYEQDFHLPMVAYWHGKIPPGTRVQEQVNFADISPTLLEAAGIQPPEENTGKSFLDIMTGKPSQADRQFTYFGREKQDVGGENDLGYPVRCIRDGQYLYIRNFEPTRWPVGNPETGFTNCDSSPTKSLILEQYEQGNSHYYELCFGKRPLEELYDIVQDPECMNNLAGSPDFAQKKEFLWDSLANFLRESGDPRIFGNGHVFDEYPHCQIGAHSWSHYVRGEFAPQRY